MNASLQLSVLTVPPVLVSSLLYLAQRRTAFGRMSRRAQQLVCGIAFGLLAILGTEFGMTIRGATMNVRSAAPLCAGLIFGAPAGLIAGVIGGVERYFATYWGAGEFTQVACSISTVVSGLLGALLRVYMFDDKKPSWAHGLAAGIVAEVFDMLMVFLVRMDETREAFAIVEICSSPMILMNGVSVMLALLAVSLLSGERRARRQRTQQISQTFQKWLLVCVLFAFTVTCVFTFAVQSRMSENETDSLLSLNIEDVENDIVYASDENLLRLAHRVAASLDASADVDDALLRALAQAGDIAEIDVIGEDGVIAYSTNPDFVGFDMRTSEQSQAFLPLLSGLTEYVQPYQPIAYDASISRKYAGVALSSGGFVQVAHDAEHFQQDIGEHVKGAARNRHVGESGSLILCDSALRIVSDPHGREGEPLDVTGLGGAFAAAGEGERFSCAVYGEPSYCMYRPAEGYYIFCVIPRSEALFSRNVSLYIMIFMEVLIYSTLFVAVYFLIKYKIVNNIRRINGSLAEITGGNLDVTVDVRSNEEFASLSDDINQTVVTLKRYIAEAAARIDEELAFAKAIQHSALPSVFPPYPNHTEFDIFAGMRTAKEVGGDFYDFYFSGENRLAFLIADVSGKGIPAAMFMMTAKTLIKDLAETGMPLGEVFTRANQELCENNEAGMFVTALMGVLDLTSGAVTLANAGHNPPLVRRADGAFEYLKVRAGFVLAGMEGIRYRTSEITLAPGDTLYLYTDGVTEATGAQSALYGEERLRAFLNGQDAKDAEAICRGVLADVDRFVGDAPQFDDITMLCLRFLHPAKGGEMHDA